MDIRKIRELVRILESSSLTDITVKDAEVEISLSKHVTAAPVCQSVPQAAAAPVQEAEPSDEESVLITAPIVGTFYSSPAPDAPAYVRVGDHVKRGQTVCILEAMKLMNEIESEFDCEIEAILVSNEQKIEYGQPLFRVRKL